MINNGNDKGGLATKLRTLQKKHLPYTPQTVTKLAVLATILMAWILLWGLVLKMCNDQLLGITYHNLKDLTMWERIMWDIIPFNYRGTDYWIMRQKIDTALNCFVFVPYGVLFCYIFKKDNVFRNAGICLGISFGIEVLQLFTMLGNPATEDLITNTLGCFVGYGLNALVFKRMADKTKVKLFATANVVLIVVVVYSIITLVGAADTIYGIVTKTL